MKSENFFVVHGWMVKDLCLSGTDRDVYAIIYGFSQDGQSKFTGSLKYLQEWTGASRSTVIRSLKNLEDRGLVTKHVMTINGVTFNHYTANTTPTESDTGGVKLIPGGCQIDTGGGIKMTPHNIVYNIEGKDSSSCDQSQTTTDKVLFDGQIFALADVPDRALCRIEAVALREGISQEDIPGFMQSLERKRNHVIVRDKGRIPGLCEIINHYRHELGKA